MKRVLLLLTGMVLAGGAQAQFGVKAGANASILTDKPDEHYRSSRAEGRAGYQLGVFYEHKLTEHLSVVPELTFSRLNTQLEVRDHSISDGGYDASYHLGRSYLSVPVLLRATFGQFYLDAGPQASFLLSAHEKGTESIGTIAGSYEQGFDRPATDRYRRYDAALCGGIGMRLPAGFTVDLRGTAGLVSIAPQNPQAPAYQGKLKNALWQVSIGYQLQPKS